MKLKDWIVDSGVNFNDTDLRFLIRDVFKSDYPFNFIGDTHLESQTIDRLKVITDKHKEGMPLAYILGKEIFFGFEFEVNSTCLIPRKETELIVEEAIKIIKSNQAKVFLDLCCGCGNIAVSIKKSVDRKLSLVASDNSFEALKVAGRNAVTHNVDIDLVASDLLSTFKMNTFDMIVTNPPYVESDCIKGSLSYEPKTALAAGEDGLYFIRKILELAPGYLKGGGYLITEIGYKHKNLVEKIVKDVGRYEIKKWIKDYCGNFRAVVLRTVKN